jgi:lipoyl(octanoyl) transferase
MNFWSITGLIDYDRAKEIQLALLERRANSEIQDTILFLEHTPVITRGRGLQYTGEESKDRPRHMPLPSGLPPEIQFAESERGGDLTYHGPGQLVVYPIVKLDGKGFGPDHDVGAFLRKVEGVFAAVLREKGLKTLAPENATGVWIETEAGPRKIASMGIAVRKWVTYHGIAINAANDLKPFHLISPCGFQPEIMTRLADLHNGLEWEGGYWREQLEEDLSWEFSRGLGLASIPQIQGFSENELRQKLGLS